MKALRTGVRVDACSCEPQRERGGEGQNESQQPRPALILAANSLFEEQQVALLACPARRVYITASPQAVRKE